MLCGRAVHQHGDTIDAISSTPNVRVLRRRRTETRVTYYIFTVKAGGYKAGGVQVSTLTSTAFREPLRQWSAA